MRTNGIVFLFLLMSLGWASPAKADIALPFKGQIDFSKKQLDFILNLSEKSSISAKASQISDEKYRLSFNIDHWQTDAFDLSSEMEGSLVLVRDEVGGGKKFLGKIWSPYSLLDYKPVRGLAGDFEIKDRRIFLNTLSFGNLDCSGVVELMSPHKVDLLLGFNAFQLNQLVGFVDKNNKDESDGLVSGKVTISGALDRLELKGDLESFDGYVKDLKFNSFYLKFDGIYPTIQLAHSSVAQVEGLSFDIDGKINLDDFKNLGRQISLLSLEPVVTDSKDEAEWTIKRLKQDDKGTMELKYLLKKNTFGSPRQPDSDMLGVERKIEF